LRLRSRPSSFIAVGFVTLPFRSLWRGGRRPCMLRCGWRCSAPALGRPLLSYFHGCTSLHTLGLSEHGPVLMRLLSETSATLGPAGDEVRALTALARIWCRAKQLSVNQSLGVILHDRHAVPRLPHLPRQQCRYWRSRPGRLGCHCRHRRLAGRKSRPKTPPAPQQNSYASRCLSKFGCDPWSRRAPASRPVPGASREWSRRQQNDHDTVPHL
jgi:hypothetical protein